MVFTGLQSSAKPRTLVEDGCFKLSSLPSAGSLSPLYPLEWLAEANRHYYLYWRGRKSLAQPPWKATLDLGIQKKVSWNRKFHFLLKETGARGDILVRLYAPCSCFETDVIPKTPAVTLLLRRNKMKNKETRADSDRETHGKVREFWCHWLVIEKYSPTAMDLWCSAWGTAFCWLRPPLAHIFSHLSLMSSWATPYFYINRTSHKTSSLGPALVNFFRSPFSLSQVTLML